MEEDKYVAIETMFKVREDKNIDTFMEMVEEWLGPCSAVNDHCDCGLMSLGGTQGTEEQCWKYLGVDESVCEVKVDDLKLILDSVLRVENTDAYDRLHTEAYWNDNFDAWLAEQSDEDRED